MKLSTLDTECVAAMMSKGAQLDPEGPWDRNKHTRQVTFHLTGVDQEALNDYRSGKEAFSISAYTVSRRFLLQIIKQEKNAKGNKSK